MPNYHTKPIIGITLVSILCGYTDYRTSDKIAYFHLSPGFSRKVDIVKTREITRASPVKWKCPYEDEPLFIDKQTLHPLIIQEDLNESFQITVESTSKQRDPIIIIKSEDNTILECQDKDHDEDELLNTDETSINAFSQEPIPKGTYYLVLGSYSNNIDEYKIIISQDNQVDN